MSIRLFSYLSIHVRRALLAITIGSGLALLLCSAAVPPALANPFQPSGGIGRPDTSLQESQEYWTEPRIAAALRNDLGRQATGERAGSGPPDLLAPTQPTPRSMPAQSPFLDPAVGKLVFLYRGSPSSCSGSLIDTPSQRVVLTAGHCLYEAGRWSNTIRFIPELRGWNRPHGSFPAATKTVEINWFNSTRYTWRQPNVRFDFGAVVLQRQLAQLIEPLPYRLYPGAGMTRLVGYPGSPGLWPRMCTSETWRSASFERPRRGPTMRISRCDLKGGSSGGPWLGWLYDSDTGQQELEVTGLSSTRYWRIGGRRAWISSPYFGFYAEEFIDFADTMLD
jgi:hypothetical protein